MQALRKLKEKCPVTESRPILICNKGHNGLQLRSSRFPSCIRGVLFNTVIKNPHKI